MSGDLVSILVIEDMQPDLELIKLTLTRAKPPGWPLKYRIHEAGTLHSAIKILGGGRLDIILLDLVLPDSGGIDTFWKVYEAARGVPIIVFTGVDTDGLFERILVAGAYRCYEKTEIAPCMRILHYTIRHVLHEHADRKLIEQQRQTITRQLNVTIRACAGCNRYYDELSTRWVSHSIYFKRHGIIESHGNCPDCHHDYYEKDLREATKDFE